MNEDPYLLDTISGRKGKASQKDEIEDTYKKDFGQAEKQRIQEQKEAAEEKKAQALYEKILDYHKSLPFVSEGGPKTAQLSKMGLKELEREMGRIQGILNSKAALSTVKRIDHLINVGIEKGLSYQGIDASGLADFTASPEGQAMLAQEYQEFAIEWKSWISSSKEFRYAMITFAKVSMIIEANKNKTDAIVPEEDLESDGDE